MKRKIIGLLAIVLIGLACASIAVTEHRLTTLEQGILRLHILANSDSDIDQILKIQVRDALLAQSEMWMYQANSEAEAAWQIQRHLDAIKMIAVRTLRENGCADTVKAMLCDTYFPVRTYGNVTLPAGIYHALRIEIGAAEGHNWWCVMYPSLCVPAVSCDAKTQMSGEFDASICDMTENPSRYTVRFKCVEIVRGIRRYAFEHLTEEIVMENDDTI